MSGVAEKEARSIHVSSVVTGQVNDDIMMIVNYLGSSRSRVISDILEEAIPHLRKSHPAFRKKQSLMSLGDADLQITGSTPLENRPDPDSLEDQSALEPVVKAE